MTPAPSPRRCSAPACPSPALASTLALALALASCANAPEGGGADAGEGSGPDAGETAQADAAAPEVSTPAGPSRFQRTFGGEWDEEARAVAQTAGGDLLVAGYTNTHGAGGWDGLLLRDDACGVPKWARAYGGAGQDIFTGVVALSGGEIAAVGRTDSFGSQVQVWVTRTDGQGSPLWSRAYGGGGHDAGVALAETDGGALVALCETYNFGPGTPKYHNLMMLGIGPDGALLWDRTFGGDVEGDAGFALVVRRDAAGATASIVVAGATESFGAGRDDIWLLVLDPKGKLMWSRAYGGPEDDEARGIAAVPGGGWAITGFTRGYGASSADIFAMQVDAEGAVKWWHRYGGAGKDRGYGVHPWPAEDGGGFVVTGFTQSFGHPAGYDDRYVMRLDEVGGLERLVTFGGSGDDQAVASVATGDGGVVLAGRSSSFGGGLRDVWLVKADGQGNAMCNMQVVSGGELDHAEKDVGVVVVLPGEASGATASEAKIETVVIADPGKLTGTACASGCP